MKKTLLLSAFAALTLPMIGQQVKYNVSGTFAGNGQKVYLIDRLSEKIIDSVSVANGQFVFNGTAAKDAFMAVRAGKSRWETPFFNDGTPVIININDSTLKGSAVNERLTKYDLEMEAPNRAFNEKVSKLTSEAFSAQQNELLAEYNKIQNDQIALANKIFADERNTLIPLAFAQLYFFDNGWEAYDELVAKKVSFASHPYLKKAKDDVEKVLKPKDSPQTAFIGQQYTDFEMADTDGKMHRISELVGKGKWVLVDFWASWCAPCRAEMPNVLEAYKKYHAKGFEIVGVSLDQKKEAWVKGIGQLQMPWLQISDLKGWKCAAVPVYKIEGIPDNILIDPQGKIVDRALRGKMLQNRLRKIFGE